MLPCRFRGVPWSQVSPQGSAEAYTPTTDAHCSSALPQLKLQFPKADDPTAFQQIIDTSLFEEAELTASTEVQRPAGQTGDPLRCYPLAIRMEAIGPSALAEGRSLSVRTLAPLHHRVQAIAHR